MLPVRVAPGPRGYREENRREFFKAKGEIRKEGGKKGKGVLRA